MRGSFGQHTAPAGPAAAGRSLPLVAEGRGGEPAIAGGRPIERATTGRMLLAMLHGRLAAAAFRATRFAGLLLAVAAMAGAANAAPPAWFLSPPANDSAAWWASGSGADSKEARRDALREMAARLIVSVEGSTESQTSVSGKSVSRISKSTVSERIREVEFSGYSVERTEQSSDRTVYVLVKVLRAPFIEGLRARLDAIDKQVADALEASAGRGAVEQLHSNSRLAPLVEEGLVLATLLEAASPDGQGAGTRVRLLAVKSRIGNASTRLRLGVTDTGCGATVADAVKAFIVELGMASVNDPAEPGDAELQLACKKSTEEISGTWKGRLMLSIAVKNADSGAVGTRTHLINGLSRESASAALANAESKVLKALRREASAVALGLPAASKAPE